MSDVSIRLGADYANQGMKQFIVDTREGETATDALTRAMREQGIASEESEQATTHAAGGMGNLNRESRALRVGMAGLIADMALASIASGEQLPQGMRESAKGLQAVTDLTVAGAFAFGPYGAAAGLAAGLLLTVYTAAHSVSPEVQAANKAIDGLAQHNDAAKGLAELAGITQSDAAAAFAASKNNNDLADALERVKKNSDLANETLQRGGGRGAAGINNAPIVAARAAEVTDKEQIQLQLKTQLYGEVTQAATKSYSEIAQLSQQRTDEEEAAAQKMTEFAKSETSAFVASAQARAQAERQAADDTLRIARELTDSLARIAQQRTDALTRINREYQDKESDLAYQEQKQAEQLTQDSLHREQQYADKVRQIKLDEAHSLEQLDFNTHESLLSAKTNAEKEDILRRAQFERGQIEQRATDQRTAAEKQMDEEKQLAAERVALSNQDFSHQHDINVRETNEKIADAKKAANEQVAAAKQRNTEETNDLKNRLKEQENDIKARYDSEIAAIEAAKQVYLQAEDAKIAKLNAELTILRQVVAFQLANIPIGDSYNPFGYEQQRMGEKGGAYSGNGGGGGRGFDVGGVVPGPQGAPRMILAHGGETVNRVGSGGGTKEASPQYVFVNAAGLTGQMIQDAFEQAMRGNVFKENVKLIFHTEAAG